MTPNAFAEWARQPGKALIADSDWPFIQEFAGMTPRETQVCRLIFEGNTREEVAQQLGISPRTIRHHMEVLHTKLDVSNRVNLVLRMIQIRDAIQRGSQ